MGSSGDRGPAPAWSGAGLSTAGQRLLDALAGPEPVAALRSLEVEGWLAGELPELAACRGAAQGGVHRADVLDHCLGVLAGSVAMLTWVNGPADGDPIGVDGQTVVVLQGRRDELRAHLASEVGPAPRWLWMRFAALLHDIGKPAVGKPAVSGTDGGVACGGHELAGQSLASGCLRRLGYEPAAVDHVGRMVAAHPLPLRLARAGPSGRSVRAYCAQLGALGVDVALLSLADNADKAGAEPDRMHRVARTVGRLLAAWHLGDG